jgi:hypothetical protein
MGSTSAASRPIQPNEVNVSREYVIHIVCEDLRAHEEISETCMRFHRAAPNSVYIDSEQSLASYEAEKRASVPGGETRYCTIHTATPIVVDTTGAYFAVGDAVCLACAKGDLDKALAKLAAAEKRGREMEEALAAAREELGKHKFSEDGERNNDDVIEACERIDALLGRGEGGE